MVAPQENVSWRVPPSTAGHTGGATTKATMSRSLSPTRPSTRRSPRSPASASPHDDAGRSRRSAGFLAVARRAGALDVAATAAIVGLAFAAAVPAADRANASGTDPLRLPWREAGWSERRAAAHLLDRFTWGARPGDVDRVVAMGLEAWLEAQLAADLPEPELERRLAPLDSLRLSAAEAARRYPARQALLREARRAGVVSDEGLARLRAEGGEGDAEPDREVRRAVAAFARERGARPQREAVEQLAAGKLLRARHAENQLADVLADFWFDHFNVSVRHAGARPLVASYEREAIRPHVLGRFRDMLGATARHPAMLLYLDNARSAADEGAPTLAMASRRDGGGRGGSMQRRRPRGLNENYARELLELHTLGVDGGYGERDVIEVARAFTGWTVLPPAAVEQAERRLAAARRLGGSGFVRDGLFLFRPDTHDAGVKTVLGRRIAAGGGIGDGEAVLDLVAAHPSTARHLAEKLARRFVSDHPPASLVDRLTGVFQASGGDLAAVVRAIAAAPEFWDPAVRQAKVKRPFELVASALRALDAEVRDPRAALAVVADLGQPPYACDPPSGYPDEAEAWLGSGALVGRMRFALALAAGELEGVDWSPATLPVAAGAPLPEALAAVSAVLLPERDPAPIVAALDDLAPAPESRATGHQTERRRLAAMVLGSPVFQRR